MKVLDIRGIRLKGEKLAKEIEELVKDTQRVIIQPLPSEILMTQEQFKDLATLARKDTTDDIELLPKDQVYGTRYNAMDIKVQ